MFVLYSIFICLSGSFLYGAEIVPLMSQHAPLQEEAKTISEATNASASHPAALSLTDQPKEAGVDEPLAEATHNTPDKTLPVAHNSVERTFAMIKPHAVADHLIGRIISLIEENKFTIVALKLHHITTHEAETFYAEHKDRPFFPGLVSMMSERPSILMVLERTDGIRAWRELAGATNPEDARPGTLRAMFGKSKQENAVHGSDSPAAAAREIALLFPELVVSPQQQTLPAIAHHQELDGATETSNHAPEGNGPWIPNDALLDEDDALSLTLPEIALQQPTRVHEQEQPVHAPAPVLPPLMLNTLDQHAQFSA